MYSVYNLVVNYSAVNQTNTTPTNTLRLITGSSLILNYSSTLKPWTIGLSNNRISLAYQLQPTGTTNLTTNSKWITNFNVGCRIIGSTTNGTRCIYPDNNSSETIGAFISLS